MSRKQSQQPDESNEPLQLMCSREEAASKINDQITKGVVLRDEDISSVEQFEERQSAYYRWDDYNVSLLRLLFNTGEIIRQYRDLIYISSLRVRSLGEKIAELNEDIDRKLNKLRSVAERLELFPVSLAIEQKAQILSSVPANNSVFVVHGHNADVKNQVARFLERIGLKVVILHEQADQGKTIIEKFEYYANFCSFAIVLLTADDMGYPKNKSKEVKPRARQNVILELGYFLAKFGRSRVCALLERNVDLPSDYQGMLWKSLEDGSWEFQLAKEIKAAGIAVDLNKL